MAFCEHNGGGVGHCPRCTIKDLEDKLKQAEEELKMHEGEDGEHILCLDCRDSGWNEDREGRSPCTCISETEPYQLLEADNAKLRKSLQRAMEATLGQCSERPACDREDCPACAIAYHMKQALKEVTP